MIPRNVVEEIIRRNDIVRTVSDYVKLRQTGSNWVGLCPFHSEKTGSFTVFPGTDSFYCFGCRKAGDVITFIKEIENLDYPSALEFLAKRAGVTIPESDGGERRGPSRDRIREMNSCAARLFHGFLMKSPEAEPARRYLADRGLETATLRHFYIGYAPDRFDWLYPLMRAEGFTDEELSVGFLCGRSNGRVFDYFRGRVIFPIADTGKNVAAFGGRIIGEGNPKYLNTSDTPAFRKSRTLFALNYAKDHCSDGLILCEGYMDVVSMHQAGFQNAVATLGTAITDEHARTIARYTDKVILAYDSDGAGQSATRKAISVLGNVGIEVRILRMNGAKDPDEFIRKFGKDAFRSLIEGSSTGFEYRMAGVISAHDLSSVQEKIKAADEIAAVIAGYGSAVERDVYVGRAASALGISADSLGSDVEKKRRSRQKRDGKEMSRAAADEAGYLRDRVNTEAASMVRGAAAEDTVIGLLLIYPEYRDAAAKDPSVLESSDFPTSFGRRAFDAIMTLHGSEGGFAFSLLGESFDSNEMSRLKGCEIRRLQLSENGRRVFDEAVAVMKEEKRKQERKDAPDTLSDSIAQMRRRLEEEKKKRGGG
ncbi:MAG: DNA primase [Clostridia bacterium]|nr:DNA primase [Clostridia bacterium]